MPPAASRSLPDGKKGGFFPGKIPQCPDNFRSAHGSALPGWPGADRRLPPARSARECPEAGRRENGVFSSISPANSLCGRGAVHQSKAKRRHRLQIGHIPVKISGYTLFIGREEESSVYIELHGKTFSFRGPGANPSAPGLPSVSRKKTDEPADSPAIRV